jgi:hypothetical protein
MPGADLGRIGGIDRVDRQASPADGVVAGPMQDSVHTTHGGSREGAFAAHSAALYEVGVERAGYVLLGVAELAEVSLLADLLWHREKMKDRRAVPALIDMLEDDDPRTVQSAASASVMRQRSLSLV